ncbi:MAG: Stp1/IreP family PP2C-type Ser/Thr phosphatase [Oscillospiraceae bacterium]|nr:Stp1/IreP family PP2C-type Ser/Thr phosphatase [Oscillospiraceae bacterium]
MAVIITGKTNTGIKRSAKANEDSFYADKINGVCLAVVCDGVGGARGGNIASSLAVKSFVETVTRSLENSPASKSNSYREILFAAVARANDAVFSAAKDNFELEGMGTTMVACLFDGREYYAINVGDSRMYLIDDKNTVMNQITKDHSLVQEMVDSGVMTKEQAEKSPNKNIITRVLGHDDVVNADLYVSKYESGIFLLCSDGLHDYVGAGDIARYISHYDDIDHCIDELITKANDNGGGDNITAVIIKP